MQIPSNEKNNLGLIKGFLIFQIELNETKSFTIEVSITDNSNIKKRLLFSSCSKELAINSFLCRIPLINFPTNIWINLSIDILGFFNQYFKNQNFKFINYICLSANCKIRKICAMQKNFVDSLNDFMDIGDENLMPKNFLLPTEIDFININIDINYINENINLKLIKVNNGNNTINNNNNNNVIQIPKTSQGQRSNYRLSTFNNNNLHNTNNSHNNNLKNTPKTSNGKIKGKFSSNNLNNNLVTNVNNNSNYLTNNTTNSNNNSNKSKTKSKSLGKQNIKGISNFNPSSNKMREKENLNLTRKRSTNILSNTNKLTINSNFSTINQTINNKNKQWNLYDQNGRRINRNQTQIRENNFELSKTQKPIKSKTPDKPLAQTINHRNNILNRTNIPEKKTKLQKTIKPPLINNKAIPDVFNINNIPIKDNNIENKIDNDKSKFLSSIYYNDDNNVNNNNNNNASIQEVFDYDQNNTLLKGENNTTRDSERIIYRDKNDNLKILNIRIKDDSNHDSQVKNSNKNFIENSLKDNLLKNINISTSNRPYTPPMSNLIPENNIINNETNIQKINESIIKNHYNEMVYDKETGKYFNSRTNIYYDLK